MGTAGPRPSSKSSPSLKWSLYVGVYALLCAAVLLLLINQLANTLVKILALPSDSALLLAAPVPVIGAVVWWAVVERRGTYTYLLGGIVGLVTALLTVLFWVLRVAAVWGPDAVLMGGVLVGFVLVVTGPIAAIAGVPLMYARRRMDAGLQMAETE